jgi:hypothetical protein
MICSGAVAAGLTSFSMLIEDRLRDMGSPWLRSTGVLLRIENYRGSATRSSCLEAEFHPIGESEALLSVERSAVNVL